ncbi:hypothetical protein CSUI_007162 [Cystoisospora suis]|uniref:Uncharacterized protein n=1 Tax=Cystoisospora suis TaxID=483139 RepID=A0A2C6KRX4_9APIC|nr:hypothetical protein CSUI_007162 [Cystoisospora suis]
MGVIAEPTPFSVLSRSIASLSLLIQWLLLSKGKEASLSFSHSLSLFSFFFSRCYMHFNEKERTEG